MSSSFSYPPPRQIPEPTHTTTSQTPPSPQTSSSSPKPEPTFTSFAHLPTELRTRIWSLALHSHITEINRLRGDYVGKRRSVLWDVCRESRMEVLLYYEGKLGVLKQFPDLGYAAPVATMGTVDREHELIVQKRRTNSKPWSVTGTQDANKSKKSWLGIRRLKGV